MRIIKPNAELRPGYSDEVTTNTVSPHTGASTLDSFCYIRTDNSRTVEFYFGGPAKIYLTLEQIAAMIPAMENIIDTANGE